MLLTEHKEEPVFLHSSLKNKGSPVQPATNTEMYLGIKAVSFMNLYPLADAFYWRSEGLYATEHWSGFKLFHIQYVRSMFLVSGFYDNMRFDHWVVLIIVSIQPFLRVLVEVHDYSYPNIHISYFYHAADLGIIFVHFINHISFFRMFLVAS